MRLLILFSLMILQSAAFAKNIDRVTAAKIGDLFEQLVAKRHPNPEDRDVQRAVFLKPHGCARAKFTSQGRKNNPGLFAKTAEYRAWVRISSDTVPATKDQANSTIGFSVKVLGVPGDKILPGEQQALTEDFLLQNHHVFFVDTAKDFLEFTESIFNGTLDSYLTKHTETDKILKAMEKPVDNVLTSTFWSTTPYKFGKANFAKYKIVPCGVRPSEDSNVCSQIVDSTQPNYLKERMECELENYGAQFCLQAQKRLPNTNMPVDKATVEWDETRSQPFTVAVIDIPAQKIEANKADCEKMSFTAWHSLPEHKPVGTVNQARGIIYKRLADYRRNRNQVPIQEPRD